MTSFSTPPWMFHMNCTQLIIFFIVSSLLTSGCEAWFHKPRCPKQNPMCRSSGTSTDVHKRHISSFSDLALLTPHLFNNSPDRLVPDLPNKRRMNRPNNKRVNLPNRRQVNLPNNRRLKLRLEMKFLARLQQLNNQSHR